jgi:hypothetical protein
MRTNARSLTAAAFAVNFLAASAATVWGADNPGRPCPNVVTVTVTYDPATKTATMSDKKIKLSEKCGDTAQWVSPDGLVYVTFAKDSPFDSPPKHDKKILKSGKPKKGSAGKTYDYTAVLELPDGSRVSVDPSIEIML